MRHNFRDFCVSRTYVRTTAIAVLGTGNEKREAEKRDNICVVICVSDWVPRYVYRFARARATAFVSAARAIPRQAPATQKEVHGRSRHGGETFL